jgi:hypothetical protein
VQEDGSFVLKTGTNEGAVVGKSRVSYTPPGGEASTDPKKEGKASPYVGLTVDRGQKESRFRGLRGGQRRLPGEVSGAL